MKRIIYRLGAATTAFFTAVIGVWIYQNSSQWQITPQITGNNIQLEKLVDIATGTIESTPVDEIILPSYFESVKRYKYRVYREFCGKGIRGTTVYQRTDGKIVGVEFVIYSSATQAKQALQETLKKATIIKKDRKHKFNQIYSERIIYLDSTNENGIQHAHISYLMDDCIRTIHAGLLELLLDFERERSIQPNGSS